MNKKAIKDGMLLQLRDGSEHFYIDGKMFRWKNNKMHECIYVDAYYDADLKCSCDKSLDIMKIYYMDELLWERTIDWSKVPFGAEVIAWSENRRPKQVGRFLYYDKDSISLKFLVFIENIAQAKWFESCELLEGGDIDG